ncbi:molybdenum cofactor biosynthesis protein MoaE [Paenirhodobacter populi]|uniref:Molybdopterin synthase catalytic subunit n=1 Tax=Paenirhodobacter populi TaxID=2306993 RepID=A0A443JI80_9RHOB|nr:molybdenum cofactor biosynthesis protein MoaE [Sinirhodobacter populi]RWR10006.1 molybdenum cofactor biosynthesis protein MoaE [Sinirhodobacter populi]RWR20210.1 molybdenum cofactor biosynthesis protein MoaE [Sinirhodobacter populi]RWR33039.1 molybdenum cofactor biosynthesis protein MoaE [Sinirhodobacter populi]
MRIAVQSAPFDSAAELAGFGGAGAGAIVTFTGIVRNDSGEMQALELEHYPGMTERAMTAIAEEAVARWSLTDVLVIHRYGRFAVGEQIMMVATAARHRKAAFEAAEFLMDYLKSRAPFWKKEIGPTGENWIAAKEADEDALKRW